MRMHLEAVRSRLSARILLALGSLLVVTLAVVLPGLAAAPPATRTGPDWKTLNDGLRQAIVSGKPVIVDVYTNWCGWCRRMDRDVYQKAEIAAYLRKNYVTVKMNAEAKDAARWQVRNYTLQDLSQQFRVSGFPTTIFLRANGEHMANVPGYVPADRFLLLLRYVAEGYADRNIPFAEFEKTAARIP